MGKIRKQSEEEKSAFDSYWLNTKQLKQFETCVEQYDSEEAFFVGLKALKIRDGQKVVMEYKGLKGTIDKVTGMTFPTDTPYHFYSKCLEQLMEHDNKVEYAVRKQTELVESESLETEVIINEEVKF